jgi:tetratricopeptide (TPR) repeat protein
VRLLIILLACGWASAATAQDIVAQAESLVREGRYAEAFALLEPHEERLAGDPKFDYLLARSALETGKPSRASFIYERILAVEPNYAGVRLEMGRAYLALGDYARAKLEFETVLRFNNLPPGLREQAEIYGKSADALIAGKKLVGYGYVEASYGYDNNVQSATGTSTISVVNGGTLILPPEALRRGDQYKALAFGGELAYSLTERFAAYGGADVRGRFYPDIDTSDNLTVEGRAGIAYNEGASNLRVGVAGGEYWLDNQKIRNSIGLVTDYRYLAGKLDQLTANVTGMRFRFPPEAFSLQDFDLYQVAVGWLHSTEGGKAAVGFTLLGGKENATAGRPDGDKPFYGGRMVLQAVPWSKISAFFVGGVQVGKYAQINDLFDEKRVDTLYDATAGISWTFAKGWSLRPQVVYYNNKSNLPLFSYDRTDTSINLRVDF